MRAIIPILAAAGCSAVLLFASPARADEGNREHHAERTFEAPRVDHAEWYRFDRDRHDDHARRERDIELARERFYASWDGNQRTRARFEAWYAQQCAAIDGR
jgi:hypothetical protein